MAGTINLSGKPFPFKHTAEGEGYLKFLNVKKTAAKQGNPEALKRYAYCIAAGAAKAENVDFDYRIDEFIKACPHNWREQVNELLNEQEQAEKGENKKAKSAKAENSEKKKTAKASKGVETNEK